MPLVGFRCPEGTPTEGTENTFEHCLHSCPHQCMPAPVLWQTCQQNKSNVHKGDLVSPTSLPRCPRKLILTRTRDYFEEPHRLYDSVRGTLIHSFLECDGFEGFVSEKRVFKKITRGPYAPWVISGQIDAYEAPRKLLHDIKTLDDKALFFMANYGPKEDHCLQLNCYRWLMDGGYLEDERFPGNADAAFAQGLQIFWAVERAQLHYCSMRRTFSTGTTFTWIVDDFREPNRGKPYKLEVGRKQTKSKRGKPLWEITLTFPDVPLMPIESVEDYVITMGPTLVRGFREDWIPPGIMDDEDKSWECSYCPVKSLCDDIEQKGHMQRLDFGPPPTDEDELPLVIR